MPQLDKVAYVSNIVWLIIAYIGFYVIILKIVLPRVMSVLRFRRVQLSKLNVRKDLWDKVGERCIEERRKVIRKVSEKGRVFVEKTIGELSGIENVLGLYSSGQRFKEVDNLYREMYMKIRIRGKLLEAMKGAEKRGEENERTNSK